MIYFLEQPKIGVVKIGTSNCPQARVIQIRAKVFREFRFLGTMAGGKNEEKDLHRRFEDLWINKEWYKMAPELLQFIEANMSPTPNGGLVGSEQHQTSTKYRCPRCKRAMDM
jgi:hypothetical protein